MRAKSLVAFAMAIGCGLVAMVGVQQTMKKQTGDPDADKITVYVASAEIPPGMVLDPTMLEKRKFLKGSAPRDAVTDLAQLEKRALIVKVMPGDIIRLDKLGEPGRTGASISIPVGMRVVTVPANMTFAHSGMLKPEDRVDLMVTYRVQPENRSGREYSETKTFLSYIEVFATDSVRDPNADADPSGKAAILKNISLLVNPEQAQTIAMAKSIGELTLNLRNTSDKQMLEVHNLTPDQFRTQILQASVGPEEHKTETTRQDSKPNADASESLAEFVNDAMGDENGETAHLLAKANSKINATREAWDIVIFGKSGSKVETVEVERRKTEPKPTQIVETDSDTKKMLNSLLDLIQPPKREIVSLKPIQVGRPIYPEQNSSLTGRNGSLNRSVPNTAAESSPTESTEGAEAPVIVSPAKPAVTKP